MTEKEIVQALRCRARHEKARNEGCKKCPYWATENLEEWQKLCGWASCKVYQIISDAADAIERLTAENEDLRKELEWKDMVITPERLRELAAADKEGRMVVLPCKVGDRLYEVTGRKTISAYKVRAIRVELFGLFIEWDIVEGFVWQSLSGIKAGEIGKTVFLTREEAERAMEGHKHD